MYFIGLQKSWLKFRIKSKMNDFQLIYQMPNICANKRTNERVNTFANKHFAIVDCGTLASTSSWNVLVKQHAKSFRNSAIQTHTLSHSHIHVPNDFMHKV